MTIVNNIILTQKEIEHKIRRIGFQIFECNVDESEIILAGIAENGYILSKKLKKVLEKITGKTIVLCKVTIDKKDIRHLTVSLEYNGPIKAPITKGEKIAELIIKKKDNNIKTLPLYAYEDLKKVNFFKSLMTSLNYLIWGDV